MSEKIIQVPKNPKYFRQFGVVKKDRVEVNLPLALDFEGSLNENQKDFVAGLVYYGVVAEIYSESLKRESGELKQANNILEIRLKNLESQHQKTIKNLHKDYEQAFEEMQVLLKESQEELIEILN